MNKKEKLLKKIRNEIDDFGEYAYKGEPDTIRELDGIMKKFLYLLKSETEKARQEGYEVGYAQGESDSGMPQSMLEFIKKEARKEVIEECIREIEKNELCLYSGDVKSISNLLNKLR